MELWTEYEGTTIDGAFPLNRLLQPEGRSALFATSDTQGAPRILRLIESHFDEDEIIARWRGVAALNHPHLLRLDDFGKVTLDETALVYAVMEPSDANLAEVLVNQRLSQAETRQLAESIASALDALHGHGVVAQYGHEAIALGRTMADGGEKEKGQDDRWLHRRHRSSVRAVRPSWAYPESDLSGSASFDVLNAPITTALVAGFQ